jgi:ABC-type transport system substrate-binding protein
VLIQADLARIGVRIRLREVSFAVYLEMTQRRGAVALSLAAWSQDFPDPSDFAELFASRMIQAENSQNSAFYSNHELDSLLDRARVEPNRAARIAMYQLAERIIVDDAPWAFMYYPVRTEAVQPYVKNFTINPVFAHDVRDVWLDLPMQPFHANNPANARGTWGPANARSTP